jgi:hypothetical protein
MTKKHIGSSFDDFLEEEGILAETNAVAIKRVVAWQIQQKNVTDSSQPVRHAKNSLRTEKLNTDLQE